MSAEIPEVFRALLEHPFTLPNFEDNGKWLLNETVVRVLLKLTSNTVSWEFGLFLDYLQATVHVLHNPCQLSFMGNCARGLVCRGLPRPLVRVQMFAESIISVSPGHNVVLSISYFCFQHLPKTNSSLVVIGSGKTSRWSTWMGPIYTYFVK